MVMSFRGVKSSCSPLQATKRSCLGDRQSSSKNKENLVRRSDGRSNEGQNMRCVSDEIVAEKE